MLYFTCTFNNTANRNIKREQGVDVTVIRMTVLLHKTFNKRIY